MHHLLSLLVETKQKAGRAVVSRLYPHQGKTSSCSFFDQCLRLNVVTWDERCLVKAKAAVLPWDPVLNDSQQRKIKTQTRLQGGRVVPLCYWACWPLEGAVHTQGRWARGVKVIKFKFIVRSRHTKHSRKKKWQKRKIWYFSELDIQNHVKAQSLKESFLEIKHRGTKQFH